jgi:leucyl aminopeptidase
MKKLLWTICFLSVGLNTYLIKFEAKRPKPIEQELTSINSSLEKKSTKKEKQSCPTAKKNQTNTNSIKIAEPHQEKAQPFSDEDSFDYDSFKKESSEKIDRFVLEELNLDLETSAQIVKVFEEGQKKFDAYLEDKQKAANPEGEAEGYFFDAYDYIRMGRNRLETRKKLKTYLGVDSFKQLEQFIKAERNKGGIAYEIL